MGTHDLKQANLHRVLSLLGMMRPHRLVGGRKVRLGRFFDGGYVMLDDFEAVDAAYSIGINDDVSWDLDVANRGIPVFQYDHTIEAVPQEHPLTTWRKLGLGSVADPQQSLVTLPDIIEQNGHQDCRNLLLKCDIEGFEWFVFSTLTRDVISRFRQIVMEIHCFNDLDKPQTAEYIRKSLVNLSATHNVIHVHGNNYAVWSVIGGVPIPSVMEITLVRKDLGEFVESDEIFPTPLDMPCNPEAADYYLGRFAY